MANTDINKIKTIITTYDADDIREGLEKILDYCQGQRFSSFLISITPENEEQGKAGIIAEGNGNHIARQLLFLIRREKGMQHAIYEEIAKKILTGEKGGLK